VEKSKLDKTDQNLTTTWVMKKKNPTENIERVSMHKDLNKYRYGLHYDSSITAAPVMNDKTICIIFTLIILAGWKGYLSDEKSFFLIV
jgi:hypothetical protein